MGLLGEDPGASEGGCRFWPTGLFMQEVFSLGLGDRRDYQCITNPPSTLIVCPVMFAARSEARNTSMFATS